MRQVGEEELRLAVLESTSFRGAARKTKLGHQTVRRRAQALNINTSHFRFDSGYVECIGKTYGLLTITSVYLKKIKGKGRWHAKCKCVCGKKADKRIDNVISLRVPSCGCVSVNRPSAIGANNPAFVGVGEFRGTQLGKIVRQASRRGLEFSVSKEYLWDLYCNQQRKCVLSGIPISFGRVYFCHETTASLDRIDSSKGYIEGNVQWTHKDVNKIKKDLNQNYFISLCKKVAQWSKTP